MAHIRDGENVVCPYCRYEHGDAFEWAAPETEGDRMECQGCKKVFVFWAEHDVTYHTRDIEGGQLLREAITQKEPFGDETYNDGTEFVRADIHAALTAERDALREDVRRMTETIRAAQHELINRGGTYALPILGGEVPLKGQTDE